MSLKTELIKVLAAMAMMILFVMTSSAQKTQPHIKGETKIKDIDFKDAARDLKCFPVGAKFDLLRSTFGDMTGDDRDDAIVLFRGQDTPRGRFRDEIWLFQLKNDRIVALAKFEGTRLGGYVLSIESFGSNLKIRDRLLVLDQTVLREGEYTPTHYYTIKYRWNDGRI